MKQRSRLLRSIGIICTCAALCLCNIPLVQAESIVIDDIYPGNVFCSGPGPHEVTIETGAVVSGNVFGYDPLDPNTGNTVNVNGGTITGGVYVGASPVDPIDNEFNMTGGTIAGDVIVGAGTGNISGNNVVHISGGTIGGDVYGSATGAGNVSGNQEFHIEGGSIAGTVYSGYTEAGTVHNNAVSVTGGTLKDFYGGYTKLGNGSGNEIIVGGGTIDNATSAYTSQGDVSGNLFIFQGGTINDITAGYTELGVSSGNRVSFEGGVANQGTVNGDVIGGYSVAEGGAARGNEVSIDFDGAANGVIAGGYSDYGDTTSNTVELKAGNVNNITGGYADHGRTTDNTVTITGGSAQTAYGGYTSDGAVRENKVIIDGATAIVGTVAGGFNHLGNAVNNEVNIQNVQGVTSIFGGQSNQGDARNNAIVVTGGTFGGGTLTGGASIVSGNAIDNRVTVSAGSGVLGNVYGGSAEVGDAVDNEVDLSGTLNITTATGGFSAEGVARGNKVEVNGGRVTRVYGGSSGYGDATVNEVGIRDTTFTGGTVVGGQSLESGDATQNRVTITDSSGSLDSIYGGWSKLGNVAGNEIHVEGGTVGAAAVAGGYSESGTATANEVSITSDGTFRDVYGGRAGNGSAAGNTVTLTGGTYTGAVMGGAGMIGDDSEGNTIIDVTDNSVSVTGSTVKNVYGSYAESGNASGDVTIEDGRFSGGVIAGAYSVTGGSANSNTVTITNGALATGGTATDVYGGYAGTGSANANIVQITGNTFSGGTIAGGYGGSGASNNTVDIDSGGTFTNVYGGYTKSGAATGNTVNLTMGTYRGIIAGGYSESGTATGNTVNIFENAILNSGALLYGGFSGDGQNSRTGNILNLGTPITVRGLDNFDQYNFFLAPDFAAGDTMITVTDGNGADGVIHLKDAEVTIDFLEPNSSLTQGDTIVLIDEQGGYGFDGSPSNATASTQLLDYTFDLAVVGNQLLASLTSAEASPTTVLLSEGFAGGIILASQGADAIAGPAMDSAMAAAHQSSDVTPGNFFGSFVGGKTRHDAGSEIDMIGISASAGVAFGHSFTNSRMTMGPFVEYGEAEYDTLQGNQITGDGRTEYLGGGFLLRVDYRNTGMGRYFAEASVRGGKLKNNFSAALLDSQEVSYDSSAAYYGFHLGYGGSWDLAGKTDLDLYGKYFWAQGRNSVTTLSTENDLDFEKIISSRIRAGARVSYTAGESVTLQFGGAYDHELDGRVKAVVYTYSVEHPGLSGGTGIGEVVLSVRPSGGRTSINFGAQGLAGKRKGVAGNLLVRF